MDKPTILGRPKIIAMWGGMTIARLPGDDRPGRVYGYRLVECDDGESGRILVVEHQTRDATGSEAWISVDGVDREHAAFRAMLADLHEDRLLINLAGIKYQIWLTAVSGLCR